MNKFFKVALVALTVTGCASMDSRVKDAYDDMYHETVVARINNRSDRPSWLNEDTVFSIGEDERGQEMVYVLGQTEIPGRDRVDAGYRIAENNAKVNVSNTIKNTIETIFQNAEEGTGMNDRQARYMSIESSKRVNSGMYVANRYWEKLAIKNNGLFEVKYKIYVRVAMPKADFDKAIEEAGSKVKLSEEFKKRVDAQFDRTLEEVGKTE